MRILHGSWPGCGHLLLTKCGVMAASEQSRHPNPDCPLWTVCHRPCHRTPVVY